MKRIAFAGTRGVPASYGGFETAVDEITKRFIASGYECDVFCRASHSTENLKEHEGRRLVYVKGARSSKLETILSSIQSGWYLLRHRDEYAHVFWFNNANLPGILMTLLSGLPVSINTDGLEWRRKKWSFPFKAYYYICAWLISKLPLTRISDSHGIKSFYKNVFGCDSIMIPYGAPKLMEEDLHRYSEIIRSYELESGRYFLQITRIEPDNYPLEIAHAFSQSGLADQGFKYVVMGYRDDTNYAIKLKHLMGRKSGVVVLPANYDLVTISALRYNCFCYIHGNSVGGTNPALLEAMACSSRILAIDVEFSREVLAGLGAYFVVPELPVKLMEASNMPDQREQLKNRVVSFYQWDAVARCYMELARGGSPVYE